MFAIFTMTPQETAYLFMFERQNWNGKNVLLLNPVYKTHIVQKKIAWLSFSEMLLPVPDLTKYASPADLLLSANTSSQQLTRGPMPFVVKTSRIRVSGIEPSIKTCANPVCYGGHLEGTRCAIPVYGIKPAPMMGFCAFVTLPEYPHLDEMRICSTSFVRLFCTDEFLKHPHVFHKQFDRLMKVFHEAVSFYEENGYEFEVGGVFLA
jgi:hypothetical protein